MEIIDITQELFSCAVYPGDSSPRFERVREMPGDMYNLTEIAMCVHNGTHMDAPRHFIADGAAIDELDLDTFFGDCVVAELSGAVTENALSPFLQSERLLVKGNAVITAEAAKTIANSGIRLLGVESQSVGPIDAPLEAHTILLSNGVILLEGLDLRAAAPGSYTLAAFPLKLAGCEGAPVRAVLLPKPAAMSIPIT
jgi:arylformamidase